MGPRALVLGGTGMLGRALAVEGRRRGAAVLALSRLQADLCEPGRLAAVVADFRPEVVFNCAALTQVDACEERHDEAFAVNGAGVGTVGRAAAAAGAALLHLSTDYVFDGLARAPYPELPAPDPAVPLCVYGQSKLAGEREALAVPGSLVVRTSWLFGPGGANFPRALARRIAAGERLLRVVDDQTGCPTYAPFLARALWDLAGRRVSGVVHYRNREPVTWYGFAVELARRWGATCKLEPIASSELRRPARRPPYSVLEVRRAEALLGRPVEDWDCGLTLYLDELRAESA